jgi:hypothetical protein
MARAVTVCGLLMILAAGSAEAQPARLVGQSIGGHMEWNPATQTTKDTRTLTFSGRADGGTVTVDFVVQYRGERAFETTRPAVVDVIVTEHPGNENAPEMTMSVDGRPFPLVVRPRTSRAIVSSISFDEFLRLTNAESIVEHAFDAELVFGAGQLRMLRSIAQRWSGTTVR